LEKQQGLCIFNIKVSFNKKFLIEQKVISTVISHFELLLGLTLKVIAVIALNDIGNTP
jgi:hypothetical protein